MASQVVEPYFEGNMSEPKFMNLANVIAERIKAGRYPDILPSIAGFSKEFSVCPATVKRVLSQLRDWDLADGEQGKYVRVNPKAVGNPYFHKNIVVFATLSTLSQPFYAIVLENLNKAFSSIYLCFHLFVSLEQFKECGFRPDCIIAANYCDDSVLEILKNYCHPKNIIKLNHADKRYHYVASDSRKAGYKALAYLAEECGHTHIGMLATQINYTYGCFRLRYEGACEYAAAHKNIRLSIAEIPETLEATEASCNAVETLLQTDPCITGIFASCDIIALGVYAYAVKHSRSIPEDLAVIGFDDQRFCQTIYPHLSTFSENAPETVEILFKLVKEVLLGQPVSLRHHTVSPRLLVRGSTMTRKQGIKS